jgi:hypothetical protein
VSRRSSAKSQPRTEQKQTNEKMRTLRTLPLGSCSCCTHADLRRQSRTATRHAVVGCRGHMRCPEGGFVACDISADSRYAAGWREPNEPHDSNASFVSGSGCASNSVFFLLLSPTRLGLVCGARSDAPSAERPEGGHQRRRQPPQFSAIPRFRVFNIEQRHDTTTGIVVSTGVTSLESNLFSLSKTGGVVRQYGTGDKQYGTGDDRSCLWAKVYVSLEDVHCGCRVWVTRDTSLLVLCISLCLSPNCWCR